MGKPKRKHPNIEETLSRPWCYYCERDFDDLKILINHQKAKHYKCERCGRRLNTAGGLSVHMTQVHKETLTSIENALANRAGLDVEIFGMEGVPDDIIQQHNQRLLQSFAEEEAERRAATGNPAPGSAGATGAKKPKFEGPSDLKKRLAEHKAKKAAEEAAGVGSGSNTPHAIPEQSQSPGTYPASASPAYPQQQPPFGAPQGNAPYQAQPQPYGQQQQQQHPAFQAQSPPPYTPQQSAFSPPGMPQFPNNQAFAPPQQFQPPGGPGFQHPQFQGGPPQFHQSGPPPFQGAPSPFQNAPPPQFQQGGPPPQFQNGHQQFQPGPPQQFQPPQFPNGLPGHQYGPPGPQSPFQQQQFQPPRHNTPPQFNAMSGMPQRPPSLPAAPGLPQRPSVSAPSVNAQQMQQLHQGQMPTPPNSAVQGYPSQTSPQGASNAPPSVPSHGPSGAPPGTSSAASGAEPKVTGIPEVKASVSQEPAATQEKKTEDKKGKKEKERGNAKLVYSDNEVSPEEKMAKMSRYAFVPITA